MLHLFKVQQRETKRKIEGIDLSNLNLSWLKISVVYLLPFSLKYRAYGGMYMHLSAYNYILHITTYTWGFIYSTPCDLLLASLAALAAWYVTWRGLEKEMTGAGCPLNGWPMQRFTERSSRWGLADLPMRSHRRSCRRIPQKVRQGSVEEKSSSTTAACFALFCGMLNCPWSRLSGPWSVLWPGYFLSQSLAVVTLQPDHMLIFWSSLDPSKVLSCFCLVNWWCSFISDQSIQTISKASAWLYYKDYCYLHILHSVYFKGLTICNGDVMRCPCEPVNQWIGESLYGLTAKPSSQPLSRFASPQNVPLRDLRYFIAPVHIFSFQWFLINLCSRYRYLIVYIVYRERNSLIEINLY